MYVLRAEYWYYFCYGLSKWCWMHSRSRENVQYW